jgi:hypothetical protein
MRYDLSTSRTRDYFKKFKETTVIDVVGTKGGLLCPLSVYQLKGPNGLTELDWSP